MFFLKYTNISHRYTNISKTQYLRQDCNYPGILARTQRARWFHKYILTDTKIYLKYTNVFENTQIFPTDTQIYLKYTYNICDN